MAYELIDRLELLPTLWAAGYFLYFGVVFSAMGLLKLPDHHAIISLLFGIVALIFAQYGFGGGTL